MLAWGWRLLKQRRETVTPASEPQCILQQQELGTEQQQTQLSPTGVLLLRTNVLPHLYIPRDGTWGDLIVTIEADIHAFTFNVFQ